jgi:hypothetical protein
MKLFSLDIDASIGWSVVRENSDPPANGIARKIKVTPIMQATAGIPSMKSRVVAVESPPTSDTSSIRPVIPPNTITAIPHIIPDMLIDFDFFIAIYNPHRFILTAADMAAYTKNVSNDYKTASHGNLPAWEWQLRNTPLIRWAFLP